jgi:general secretion pathway protein F
MNQELPLPTRLLLQFSDFLVSYWWVLLLLAVGLFLLLRLFARTRKGRRFFDALRLRLPLVRTVSTKLAVARFARTLGSLLENGVSLLTALEVVRNISGNVVISAAIDDAAESVNRGKGLGDALAASGLFPPLSIQMIQVGEKSGELETILGKVAQMYENDLETAVMSLTALIEPLLILVMGVVVGLIVLSVCLPIFEMNRLVA